MREWKYWTRNKLQILAGYLPAFNRASQSSHERVYIDLLAGEPFNRDKDTGETFDGSARLALAATPAFTRLALCEKNASRAAALQADLIGRHPGDTRYKIYVGDCNETIIKVLAELCDVRRAPTFAFVDQQAAEVRWTTLEHLATYRTGPRKVELWILASPAMIAKGVAGTNAQTFAEKVDLLYGTDDWRRIQVARQHGRISAGTYREEMVNLLRWRLETSLGYAITERIPMHMVNDTPIYDMVFATDHPVGHKIMTWLYQSAAEREPRMKEEIRRLLADRHAEATGQHALFVDDSPIDVPANLRWTSTDPWDPTSRPWW